eukprot:15120805-Heterocapsa_arctica.AAC.1
MPCPSVVASFPISLTTPFVVASPSISMTSPFVVAPFSISISSSIVVVVRMMSSRKSEAPGCCFDEDPFVPDDLDHEAVEPVLPVPRLRDSAPD